MSEANRSLKAVFLDRDGVINRPLIRDGKPYPPCSLEEFELLPDVEGACSRLKAGGFLLIVVTNQPDVGRGTIALDVVEAIHERMLALLPIDRVEVSYASGREQPADECRKPRPGLLLKAARDFGIDLSRSFMVGDRWRDIDAGHAAGCRTIFIDRLYQEQLRAIPNYIVSSLWHAVDIILDEPSEVLTGKQKY